MKFNPGIHIVMHSVLSLKPGVTFKVVHRHQGPNQITVLFIKALLGNFESSVKMMKSGTRVFSDLASPLPTRMLCRRENKKEEVNSFEKSTVQFFQLYRINVSKTLSTIRLYTVNIRNAYLSTLFFNLLQFAGNHIVQIKHLCCLLCSIVRATATRREDKHAYVRAKCPCWSPCSASSALNFFFLYMYMYVAYLVRARVCLDVLNLSAKVILLNKYLYFC